MLRSARVSRPGDRDEREADRAADAVARGERATVAGATVENAGSGGATSIAAGGGRPLSPEARAFMERRFGEDFADVRCHDDARSWTLARSLGARAITHGRNIYLGAGATDERGDPERRLLAHELAHVVQQRNVAAPVIHRYTLSGFPDNDQPKPFDATSRMHAAIATASSTVADCKFLDKQYRGPLASRILGADYVADPTTTHCGHSGQSCSSCKISVGGEAFSNPGRCGLLSSTLAHEAGHNIGMCHPDIYRMEAACFNETPYTFDRDKDPMNEPCPPR